MSDLTAQKEQDIHDHQILHQESLAEDEMQRRHDTIIGRLIDRAHPSHDFQPDDDVIACDVCGCRTYNHEAKQPCEGVPQ